MKLHELQTDRGATNTAPIRSLQSFITGVGIKPVTAWRMRKRGWLTTINIAGRQYITAEAIDEFKRRAAAGEFAQEHKTPLRKASVLPSLPGGAR